jgi:hypothetical protein
MKQVLFASSIVQGGGKRRGDGMERECNGWQEGHGALPAPI